MDQKRPGQFRTKAAEATFRQSVYTLPDCYQFRQRQSYQNIIRKVQTHQRLSAGGLRWLSRGSEE
ncbi:unnamed protein product, partial [Nesidiocoris tenuis]